MRFRLGLVTGFAAGYYLGTKAGRQRYDQINRQLARLKRSDAFEQATDRARTVVEEGVDKARTLVEARSGNGHGSADNADSPAGETASADTGPAPESPPGLGGYSSSR